MQQPVQPFQAETLPGLWCSFLYAHDEIKRTADALNMQRSNLYKKIDRYELRKPSNQGRAGETPAGE